MSATNVTELNDIYSYCNQKTGYNWSNLCISGNPVPLTGEWGYFPNEYLIGTLIGPGTWMCQGINGGGDSANTCGAGSAAGYSAGSCGGSQTWSCNGLNGGSNASCSIANAPCCTRTDYEPYRVESNCYTVYPNGIMWPGCTTSRYCDNDFTYPYYDTCTGWGADHIYTYGQYVGCY